MSTRSTASTSKWRLLTVVGPSGSGRGTLLHIIGALDRPSSGEVRTEVLSALGHSREPGN